MSSPELDLDPTDPLNLLLRDSRHNSDPAMVSEWSTLWPGDSANYNMGNMDIGLDFHSESMGIDPSALHFDSQKLNYHYDEPTNPTSTYSLNDVLASAAGQSFPFTFQPGNLSFPGQRRLSVTSSSESSSGASLSPVMEHKPVINDPAVELAQRVRQSAGVMLAVPMQHQHHIGPQASPIASTPPQSLSFSSASSAASTPPPSTPPPTFAEMPDVTAGNAQSASGILVRPKTSHTTIERRYRTNLNARIQSLRMAVPALRVLENQTELGATGGSSRKVKVKVPIGKVFRVKHNGLAASNEEEYDIVDERGFVDGVKVARKCSKANVLGKAVEYIRVLKKREQRLKREQDGLKALVAGLVGGASLLNTWEREWKENFGGAERDELNEEDLADNNAAADSDDDDEDDDDDDERRRKKTKTVPAAKPVPKEKKQSSAPAQPAMPGADGFVPEKRKRGRPRKIPAVAPPVQGMPQQQVPGFAQQDHLMQQHAPQGPAHYLLATFALFSFFNSPLTSTSYSSPTTHSGLVISNSTRDAVPVLLAQQQPWGWRDLVQMFHLFVSFCVLASFVLPWLPGKFTLSRLVFWGKQSDTTTKPATSLLAALDPEQRGKPEEEDALRRGLGVSSISAQMSSLVTLLWRNPTVIEGKAWTRLAELQVLSGSPSSWDRIITALHLGSYLSSLDQKPEQATQQATIALLLQPLGTMAHAKTTSAWEDARKIASLPHEKLVMESLDVEEALALLSSSPRNKDETPIQALGATLIKQRVIASLEKLFIRTVFPPSVDAIADECSSNDHEETERESGERKQTITAAKSLGGSPARLGTTLEEMWASSTSLRPDEDQPSNEDNEEDDGDHLKALATSITLFRSLFPPTAPSSSLLSPPPSPSSTPQMGVNTRGRTTRSSYLLRRALGSSVFEAGADGRLEDARDRVVDLLAELERRERRRS